MDASSAVVTVERLDRESTSRWDSFVQSCPDATFFHRAGWKYVIETSFGHRCYFLYAQRAGAICGVLPLVHIKSALFGNSLVSTGFTVGGGPAVTDVDALPVLEGAASDLADQLDVDFLEFRSGTQSRSDWANNAGLYVHFAKPIGPDSENDMLAIPRKQRAMVRKGIKAGLTSVIDDHVDRLHPVYAESVRNLGTPVFSKAYFRNLLETFSPDLDIVTVVRDGQAIASVMNFYFRDQVLPYYGGGVLAARNVAGNDFMYWEVMRRAVDRGCRKFDFGRSKQGTGAYSFKKNWGFEPQPLTYEYKLRKLKSAPEINPLNPKYRFFIAAWKKLPLPVAGLLGPYIVRNLG
jgi:FemAB-related protein (PEP-CTERM system-associated)